MLFMLFVNVVLYFYLRQESCERPPPNPARSGRKQRQAVSRGAVIPLAGVFLYQAVIFIDWLGKMLYSLNTDRK